MLGTGGRGRKLSTECADSPQSSMMSSSLNDSTKHGFDASLLRQYCDQTFYLVTSLVITALDWQEIDGVPNIRYQIILKSIPKEI